MKKLLKMFHFSTVFAVCTSDAGGGRTDTKKHALPFAPENSYARHFRRGEGQRNICFADHNQTRKPSALVTLIVDLRGESKRRRDQEHEQAKSLGMHFVTIPGNGWSSPTDQQIAQFFALIRERPPHKNLRPLLVRW